MKSEATIDGASPSAPATPVRFENPSWRNWTLLVVVLLVTTVGLVTALPLIGEGGKGLWPWQKTELTLLLAYALLVVLFVVLLTGQQRRIIAVENRSRREIDEKRRRNMSRLYALLNVSAIMERQTEPQGVFDCITKMCVETLDCDQASLMLLDKSRGRLEVRSAFGHADPSGLIGCTRALGEGVAGWVAAHRRPLLLGDKPDANCPPELRLEAPQLSAAMVVPIILRDELVGVINVSTRRPAARFDDEDLHALLVFASNAGACIRHTEQAAWMREVIRRRDSKPAPVAE
jgi:transcriptional regulator with GAF, ATPase, and Fis domain